MQYELRLSSPSLDVLPLAAIADAVARAAATGGDTPFHKPTYQGKFRNLLEWVVTDAREGRLAVTDQDGKPWTFDESIQRAKDDGTYSEVSKKSNEEAASNDVDLDATHALCVYTTLKNLNDWAGEQGNQFAISRVGWIDERGWVEPNNAGFDRGMRQTSGEHGLESGAKEPDLSEEACIELASQCELYLEDWTDLTGLDDGEYGAYIVSEEGVIFRRWEERYIKCFSTSEKKVIRRTNRRSPSLGFPCTPKQLLEFVDKAFCVLWGSFSVPEAFRLAVAESPQTPGSATSGEGEAGKPPTKIRTNKTRAIVQTFIEAGIPKNIEAIWFHIRSNAGKDGFPFKSASLETATDVDGKMVKKKNMGRILSRLPTLAINQ